MKKFSLLIILNTLILIFSLVIFSSAVGVAYAEKQYGEIYTAKLTQCDLTFADKAIAYTPFNEKIENKTHAEYIAELENNLTDSTYKGYISPSSIYKIKVEGIGNKTAYTMQNVYLQSYDFGLETSEFVDKPATGEQATLIFGSAYKATLAGKSTINLTITTEENSYELEAKVVGFIEGDKYDPVNKINTQNAVYISDLSGIISEDIKQENTVELYTLIFENKQEGIEKTISNYGVVYADYDYFYDISNEQEDSFARQYYYDNVANVSLVLMIVSFLSMAYIIFSNMLKNNENAHKKAIMSIVMIIISIVVYLIVGSSKVMPIVYMIIPYILAIVIIFALAITILIGKKRA